MSKATIDEQVAILMRGTDFGDEQTKEHMQKELRERLIESESTGKPLRVYCGYDATGPHLHLGHTVTLRRLRLFQELGHDVTVLIGTFTASIGDASDRESARTPPTEAEIWEHAQGYIEQVNLLLDIAAGQPAAGPRTDHLPLQRRLAERTLVP